MYTRFFFLCFAFCIYFLIHVDFCIAQCPGPALTIGLANTSATCPSNGTITVTAGGGGGTYQYQITAGPLTRPLQTSNVFNSLPPGTYTVRVQDNCNNSVIGNTTVSNGYTSMTISRTFVNPTCNTPGNGTITTTATGGSVPLSYRLLQGATVIAGPQTSNVFSNLPSGNYTLEVTDACGEIRSIATNLTYSDATFNTTIKTQDNVFIGDGGGLSVAPEPFYSSTQYLLSGAGPVMISCDSIAMRFSKLILTGPSTVDNRPRRVWVKELATGNIVYDQIWTPSLSLTMSSPTCSLKIGVDYRIYYDDLCDNLDSTDRNWGTMTTRGVNAYLINKCGSYCLSFIWNNDYNTKNKYSAPSDTATIISSSVVGDPVVGSQAIFNVMQSSLTSSLITICGITPGRTYTIQFKNICTTYTKTVTVAAAAKTITPILTAGSCKKNLSTWRILVQGLPVETDAYIAVTGGPTSFTDVNGNVFPITYPISDTLPIPFGDVNFYLRNLPVGSYSYKVWTGCGGDTMYRTLTVTESDIYKLENSITVNQSCNGLSSITVNSSLQQWDGGVIYLYKKNTFGVYSILSQSPAYSVYPPGFPSTYTFSSLLDGEYRIIIYPVGIPVAAYVVNDCDTIYMQDVTLQYKLPVLSLNTGGFVCTPGGSDGKVELHLVNGVAPFSFQRLSIPGNTVITTQSDSTFTGLPAGTYRFRVTDFCGNAVIQDISIDTLLNPTVSNSLVGACSGGTLKLYSTPIYPGATYSWSGPGGTYSSSDSLVISPVTVSDYGNYTLVQTIPGCSNARSTSINVPNYCIVLPVSLSSFTASVKNCNVNIQWKSATETNLNCYQLEFSTDGVEFTLVKRLPATGNNHNYSCLHMANVKKGFYRLKFIEQNGSEYYSKIISVNFECDAVKLVVSPNPAQNFAIIWIDGLKGVASGLLYNNQGRLVQKHVFVNGANKLSVENLPSAIYTLQVTDSKGTSVRSKIVIGK